MQLKLQQVIQKVPFSKPLFQISRVQQGFIGYAKVLRWMTIEHLKWGLAQSCMETCVIPIFSQWQPLAPLPRTSMHTAPQKRFQTLIQPFGLAIHLGMIRRAHQELCVSQLEHLSQIALVKIRSLSEMILAGNPWSL